MDKFLDNLPDIGMGRRKQPKVRKKLPASKAAAVPALPLRQGGLKCPRCGGMEWETVTTKRIPGGVRRYRVCENCGRGVRTRERIEK